MARKISFMILSVAILAIGIIAFNKLSYWDRSVRIFGYSSDSPFEGRSDRGRRGGEFESREGPGRREGFIRQERPERGFARPEMRNIPDSIRSGFKAMEGRPGRGTMERNVPDSLRQQFRSGEGERMGRGTFEGGIRNGEGRGRGEFAQGRKLNLRNVLWFLAVFAAFTVLILYIDKVFCLIRKRKLR